MQEKTGTFSCVFIKCNENGLQWVGDKKNGYQQGHFMRVAGSNDSSTIGTYMSYIWSSSTPSAFFLRATYLCIVSKC